MTPQDTYNHVVDVGEAKLKHGLREAVTGVLAGCYIGFGFTLSMLTAGQLSPEVRASQPGLYNFMFGALFPMGVIMCVVTGASLFTSNILYMSSALIERKATLLQVACIWGLSYAANLAGSLLLGQLMIWGEVFHGRDAHVIELAVKNSFGTALGPPW